IGVVFPMLFTDKLPVAKASIGIVAPPPPPPPPAAPKGPVTPKMKQRPRKFDPGKLTAPGRVPEKVAILIEEQVPAVNDGRNGVGGGVPGGKVGGVIDGILNGTPTNAPPPPPEVKKKEDVKPDPVPDPPKRVVVGGKVQAAMIQQQPKPGYPKLAKDARVQGV